VDEKYYPARRLEDAAKNVVGYVQGPDHGAGAEAVRRRPDAENVMRQAANLKNFASDAAQRHSPNDTSPTHYQPMEEMAAAAFQTRIDSKCIGDR